MFVGRTSKKIQNHSGKAPGQMTTLKIRKPVGGRKAKKTFGVGVDIQRTHMNLEGTGEWGQWKQNKHGKTASA